MQSIYHCLTGISKWLCFLNYWNKALLNIPSCCFPAAHWHDVSSQAERRHPALPPHQQGVPRQPASDGGRRGQRCAGGDCPAGPRPLQRWRLRCARRLSAPGAGGAPAFPHGAQREHAAGEALPQPRAGGPAAEGTGFPTAAPTAPLALRGDRTGSEAASGHRIL